MNIPPKYEDVVAQLETERARVTDYIAQRAQTELRLEAALGREAALREDNERLHKLYPDERRRSIDFHNAICRIQDQQRVWLMRFGAKYGDSTDLKLFDELRQRDAETAALQQRSTVAEQQVKHWIGVSSEATCWAASLNEQVGEQSGVLLNLIMSNIDLDEHGFFSLSGIRPDNFWSAVEAAGARIDLEASVSATRITAAAKYPSLVEAFPDSPGGYYNGCPSSALSDPMQCWRDGYEKAKKRAIDAGFKVKP